MPSVNKTVNYGLNQWQGNEYPKRKDFVDDNLIIDTKINEVNTKVNEHKADNVKHTNYATASGVNTYSTSITDIKTLVEGLSVKIKFGSANTATSTLNINGLGAKAIRKGNGNNLTSGNIKAGQICHLVYTGTVFQLLGEGGEYGTAISSDVYIGKTIGTEQGLIEGTNPYKIGSEVVDAQLNLIMEQGQVDWMQSDIGTDIAVDSAGNVYVVENGISSSTTVSKYSYSGTKLWTKTRTAYITSSYLYVDESDHLYLVSSAGGILKYASTNGALLLNKPITGGFTDVDFNSNGIYVMSQIGSSGQVKEYNYNGDLISTIGIANQLNPHHIGVDETNYYISYGDNYVRAYKLGTTVALWTSASTFTGATRVVSNANGLYFLNGMTTRIVKSTGVSINSISTSRRASFMANGKIYSVSTGAKDFVDVLNSSLSKLKTLQLAASSGTERGRALETKDGYFFHLRFLSSLPCEISKVNEMNRYLLI